MKNTNTLQIRFINLPISEQINELINKKFKKDLTSDFGIHSIICNVSKQSAKGGEKYSILLEVHMKGSGFAIKEAGNDLYRIVEIISDKLHQKIHKFNEKNTDIHTTSNVGNLLSDQLIGRDLKEIEDIKVVDLGTKIPILERKQYSDNSPIHLEEAVELLELNDKPCFLFRNIETSKYTVIYKLNDGRNGYGMIEPKSL